MWWPRLVAWLATAVAFLVAVVLGRVWLAAAGKLTPRGSARTLRQHRPAR